MKRTAFNNARGFSTIQLVITVAVMTIVTGFAVVSISRAREDFRLMNSARQFAAYVERARGDAVRRHNSTTVLVVDDNTYSVTMDWEGFGNPSTRNFDLEQGIVFTEGMQGKSVQFNWRGRAINGEQLFGFTNRRRSVNVGVTGSGDVTFEAEYFYDFEIPPVTVTEKSGDVLPEPGATPGYGSPTPSPSPGASPTPTAGASPTPTATPVQNPTPTPTPAQYPTPTPTPAQNPTPTPTPTPQPCVLNASPASLSMGQNSSATVRVNRTNVTGAGTIKATSGNPSQIQVTPASRSVNGTAAASFTITVTKTAGSVTFSSTGCTSKTVGITIQ